MEADFDRSLIIGVFFFFFDGRSSFVCFRVSNDLAWVFPPIFKSNYLFTRDTFSTFSLCVLDSLKH